MVLNFYFQNALQLVSQDPDDLYVVNRDISLNGPFQMADVALMSEARKSLIQMNTIRRVYMTLVSAYTHTFERIASKLSKDATSSSHYGDWQLSLMESQFFGRKTSPVFSPMPWPDQPHE